MPEMRACGVGGIVAVQARGSLAETDFLLQLAAQEPRILGVVGWADLSAEGLGKQLEQWVGQTALKGFRHILQDEPNMATLIESAAFNRGVSLLQKERFVYDVLLFGHQLPAAVDFVGVTMRIGWCWTMLASQLFGIGAATRKWRRTGPPPFASSQSCRM